MLLASGSVRAGLAQPATTLLLQRGPNPRRVCSSRRRWGSGAAKASSEGDEPEAPAERPVESLFEQELKRRGIPNSQARSRGGSSGDSGRQFGSAPPPPFAGRNTVIEDTPDQLKRSRELNSEGLEGLIPRATELLKLGLSFFLAFGPFIIAVGLAFGAISFVFGDKFVHGGAVGSGPPPYIDPELLLSEPTVDPTVPLR